MSSEGPAFEINECISEISKKMVNGRLKRIGKSRSDECSSPACKSFKVRHNFECTLRANQDCDSAIARNLNGRLTSPRLKHGLISDGQGRGAHHGNFAIVGTQGTQVKGILGGITNAGTHHGTSDCEPCNIKGHMEGRLVGDVTKGPLKGGRIFASYMIFFEHSPEFTNTIANGELEGILVRDCTD